MYGDINICLTVINKNDVKYIQTIFKYLIHFVYSFVESCSISLIILSMLIIVFIRLFYCLNVLWLSSSAYVCVFLLRVQPVIFCNLQSNVISSRALSVPILCGLSWRYVPPGQIFLPDVLAWDPKSRVSYSHRTFFSPSNAEAEKDKLLRVSYFCACSFPYLKGVFLLCLTWSTLLIFHLLVYISPL